MISRNLAVALMETVRQHAETFHNSRMDLDRTLSAIGDLASEFLAEIPSDEDRIAHYRAFARGTLHTMMRKAAADKESLERH